jgi:hypothetical protein
MSVHIQSVDMDVWDAVANGLFQPQVVANGVAQNKLKANWIDDDKKKVQYNLKARNILISSLGVNEYHFVSHCKTSKDMGDALETLHTKEPMKLNNQILIPLCNNMSFFIWKMVKPSLPCK